MEEKLELDNLITQWFNRQSEKVQLNSIIDFLEGETYHITPDVNLKVLEPRSIKRIIKGEDQTVKRICTADTLLGCLRGYASLITDTMTKKANCGTKVDYKGIYRILKINYQRSIIPNDVLCPMAKTIDERWLVDFKENNQYNTNCIGEFYIESITEMIDPISGIDDYKATIFLRLKASLKVSAKKTAFKKHLDYKIDVVGLNRWTLGDVLEDELDLVPLLNGEYDKAFQKDAVIKLASNPTFEDWGW